MCAAVSPQPTWPSFQSHLYTDVSVCRLQVSDHQVDSHVFLCPPILVSWRCLESDYQSNSWLLIAACARRSQVPLHRFAFLEASSVLEEQCPVLSPASYPTCMDVPALRHLEGLKAAREVGGTVAIQADFPGDWVSLPLCVVLTPRFRWGVPEPQGHPACKGGSRRASAGSVPCPRNSSWTDLVYWRN